MNGLQIETVIKTSSILKARYNGICTASHLNQRYMKSGYVIVNTSSRADIIGHWLLFFIDNSRKLYFYDSFGKHVEYYGGAIAHFYNSYPYAKIMAITYPIQYKTSLLCGVYCLYFAHEQSRNLALKKIVSIFKRNDRRGNDLKMRKFLLKISPQARNCQPSFCTTKMFNSQCCLSCLC